MTGADWDLEVKPHLAPIFAYSAAAIVLVAHIAVGALLKVGSTGVIFRTYDQVAIATVGAVIAGFLCLFARPRLPVLDLGPIYLTPAPCPVEYAGEQQRGLACGDGSRIRGGIHRAGRWQPPMQLSPILHQPRAALPITIPVAVRISSKRAACSG